MKAAGLSEASRKGRMTEQKPKPFNWLTFLEAAVKQEPSEEESLDAIHLAGNWPTCACGELCKALPRLHCGSPTDAVLIELGNNFIEHVARYNWPLALETFHQIEARTAVLLGEMGSGLDITCQ